MIRFACCSCGKPLRVPSRLAGKRGRCEWCGAVNPVPNESTAPVGETAGVAVVECTAEVDARPVPVAGFAPAAAAGCDAETDVDRRPDARPDHGEPIAQEAGPPDPPPAEVETPSNGEVWSEQFDPATEPEAVGERAQPGDVATGEEPAATEGESPDQQEAAPNGDGEEAVEGAPPVVDVTFDEAEAAPDASPPVEGASLANERPTGDAATTGEPTAAPEERTALARFVRPAADEFPSRRVLTVDVKRSAGPSPFRSTADVHVRETLAGVTDAPVSHFSPTTTPLAVERPTATRDESEDRTAADFFDYVSAPPRPEAPAAARDDDGAAGAADESPAPLEVQVFDPVDEDEAAVAFERTEPLQGLIPAAAPPPAPPPDAEPVVQTIHVEVAGPVADFAAAPAHLRFGRSSRRRSADQVRHAVNKALITGGIIGFGLGVLASAWLL